MSSQPSWVGDTTDLARRIRERNTVLPLVLFSSLGRREAGDDERLFNAYLAKPIRVEQLVAAIKRLSSESLNTAQDRHEARVFAAEKTLTAEPK